MPVLPFPYIGTATSSLKGQHKDPIPLAAFISSAPSRCSVPIDDGAVVRSKSQDLEVYVVVLLGLGQGTPKRMEIVAFDGFNERVIAIFAIARE